MEEERERFRIANHMPSLSSRRPAWGRDVKSGCQTCGLLSVSPLTPFRLPPVLPRSTSRTC